MSKSLAIYESFILAYIKRINSEELTPAQSFVVELHRHGIEVTENEAKALAYEIAYEGACALEDVSDD